MSRGVRLKSKMFSSAPAHITADHVSRGGDLVDFVDVDDAVLGARDVAVRFLHQLADQILDVAAHVAGLAEFGRVGFDKRNTDKVGDVAHEVSFTDAGRTGDDHILLGVFDRRRFATVGAVTQKFRVVVMVADRDGEDLFGFVLLDDETVEVRFDVARGEVEIENVFIRARWLFAPPGWFGRRRTTLLLESGLQESLETALQFLGTGKVRIAHFVNVTGLGPGANPLAAGHQPLRNLAVGVPTLDAGGRGDLEKLFEEVFGFGLVAQHPIRHTGHEEN